MDGSRGQYQLHAVSIKEKVNRRDRPVDWSRGAFQLGIAGRAPINHVQRFRTSPHTQDLYNICRGAIALTAVVVIVTILGAAKVLPDAGKLGLELMVAFATAMLGVVSWSYQAANARFGAADLFAGEIGALCRIAAVAELMTNYTRLYRAGESPPAMADSTNDYFAVFNNNAKDVEVLDGDVVGAVSQFYVNMKIFQDCLLRGPSAADASVRKQQQLATMYYGFLAFESARLALAALIDDRDRCEEAILMAMMSELPGYFFLYDELHDRTYDVRWQRIAARRDGYRRLIQEIDDHPPRTPCVAALGHSVVAMWHDFAAENHSVEVHAAQ